MTQALDSPKFILVHFSSLCSIIRHYTSLYANIVHFGSIACLALVPLCAQAAQLTVDDIEAIGRTTYAEAGSETDSGKSAVISVILNRWLSGQYGPNLQSVIEQRNAFEPVTRAGGWRNLPPLTPSQRARIETILSLQLEGALGDVSQGATYFQNPDIVSQRAREGTVRPSLVGFGGMPQTTKIGSHTFYSPSGVIRIKPTPIPSNTAFLDHANELSDTVFLNHVASPQ